MRAAFTLTEILIVIVLLGLMATVAIPALPHRTPTAPAAAAADTIAALLQAVHRRAIQHGAAIDVVIDPATAHYWIRPRRPSGADSAFDGTLTLPSDVTLGAPVRARFAFDPAGTAAGDRITATDARGSAAVVTLDPWTGEVENGASH
jgi:general secretion pathway protein H